MALDCIRQQYKRALRKRCNEQGCSANTNGLRHHVILKGEELTDGTEKICDCFFFLFKDGVCTIALVELKGKDIDVSAVVEKLTNSTRIASDILRQCGIDRNATRWYHFLYSKAIRSAAQRVLTKSKVRFEGRQFNVIRKRCGTPLLEAIERLS